MCALRIHVRLIKRPLNSNTHTALELSAWVLAVFIALCVCYINKETQQKNREFFVHIFFLSYFVPSTFAMHSRGMYNHRRIAENNAHNFQFIIFHFYLFLAKLLLGYRQLTIEQNYKSRWRQHQRLACLAIKCRWLFNSTTCCSCSFILFSFFFHSAQHISTLFFLYCH